MYKSQLNGEGSFKSLSDGGDKRLGVHSLDACLSLGDDQTHKILGHDAVVQSLDAGGFQLIGEGGKIGKTVQLTSLAERARPSVDGGHGVGGGLFTAEIAVVVLGHGAVGGLVLIVAVRGDEDRGHHGERTEGGGHHVGHDVAVVILACPDEAALTSDDAGYGVVNEGVEVADAQLLEFLFVALLIDLLEDQLKGLVILLGDGVLGGEPQLLLGINGELEAGMGKGADGGILVVGTLQDAGTFEIINGLTEALVAVLVGEHQLCLAFGGDTVLGAFVDVTVGVTGDGDGLLPVANSRADGVDEDGRAEHGAVQYGADGAVGGLPHLGEVIFLHALLVGGDGGAFDGHAVLLVGVGGVNGDLILGLLALDQTEIVVLGLEVHEGQEQLVLDHLPQNAGHFVPVHLDEGGCHFDLFHCSIPPNLGKIFCIHKAESVLVTV